MLSGIKVIEVGQALAGPLAGMIFADLGADVIKIERPGAGDDARGWGPPFVDDTSVTFRAYNRGKRSVVLDLKRSEDVETLKELVRDADILVQNLRAGVVESIGIGPADLMAVNPRLIYCSISAFGGGPMRDKPGFDPLLQAFGAVMTLTGRADDPPTFCAPAINDKATGMWCVIGALAALREREATGRGRVIDTSLFESAVAWVETQLNGYLVSGEAPKRTGAASAALVPYQTFETATRPICIAAGNDRLFVAFAKAVGHAEWTDDPRFESGRKRAEHRAELIPLIQEVLIEADRETWIARLDAVGVPCCEVNDIPELAASEQLASMDLMRHLPGDGIDVVGLPMRFDGNRPEVRAGSPTVGEHTDEVLGFHEPE